jgi:hypothetical protein
MRKEFTSKGRFEPVPRWLWLCAAALLVTLSGCTNAQNLLNKIGGETTETIPPVKPVHTAKKAAPKPEPTQQELFDYIRGKLLSLSPADGINDNLEVAFDPATSVLSITQPDGRCDIFLASIDTNSALWEEIDPSETYHQRPEILRLTMNSLSGKTARTCYDNHNKIDKSNAANRARLLFSRAKAEAVPGFTEKMGKALKKLVLQCGGAPEKELTLGR